MSMCPRAPVVFPFYPAGEPVKHCDGCDLAQTLRPVPRRAEAALARPGEEGRTLEAFSHLGRGGRWPEQFRRVWRPGRAIGPSDGQAARNGARTDTGT
jgi:hypothetical protein